MHFLTFTTTGYTPPTRILHQAKEFGIFDTILHKTERDIPEFIAKHSNFIKAYAPGYGLFIWKPMIILETLLKMKENEILFYCDSGIYLNVNGLPRFMEYISFLKEHSMVSFCCNERYKTYMYVKQDAIQSYYPEFNSMRDMPYCYAGAILFKNNEKTIAFLKDWLSLCETYSFLDGSISIHPEVYGFQGQDKDNGLFALVKAKHKIHYDITPDETNIYKDGAQIIHSDMGNFPDKWDWSSLDKYPIQCRRDR